MTCIKGLKIATGVCAAAALIATATGPEVQACGAGGFMGGMGANLFPLAPAPVELVTEDVQLIFVDRRWHVDSAYEFRNLTPSEVTVRMAFPEHRCDPSFAECEGEYAYDRMPATVRGAMVDLRQGYVPQATPTVLSADPSPTAAYPPYPPPSDDEEPAATRAVWMFDVTFAPEEAVTVRHRYQVPSSGYYDDGSFSLEYIASAHAQWSGSVGLARFRLRLPTDSSLLREAWLSGAGLARVSTQPVETEFGPLVEVAFEAGTWSPQDITFQFRRGHSPQTAYRENDGATLTLDDILRGGPARAGYDDDARCPDFQNIWQMAAAGIDWEERSLFLESPADDLVKNLERICTNQMFAVYGMRFQDDRLNRYFYGPDGWVPGSWPYGFMEPNPDFDIERLQSSDWLAIDYFRRVGLQSAARNSDPTATDNASSLDGRHVPTCSLWRRGDPWCGPTQRPL
jgi:hypothetical protein